MRLKLLSLFAALILLGACETAPSDEASTGSEGASGGEGAVSADTLASEASEPELGPEPGSQEDLVVDAGDRVFFGFDKYSLDAEAQETLKLQAVWLKQNASITITVEGHCDERGTREYNLALGERRASAVKDYLMALGVDGGRIATISYGKERPAVLGSNEWAWDQNRRGVTIVN